LAVTPHEPNGNDCPGTVEHSFPGTKDSVALARSWLREMLEKFGIGDGVGEDAVLVLSELATNAAIHSRSSEPHGHYLVRLRRGVNALRLEVVDAGGRTEPRARRNGNPHPFADSLGQEGGHGLALVEAFTTRWWTRGNEKGRTVGAELALPQAP
jgi:serine/threonine-protein kinase RsbW